MSLTFNKIAGATLATLLTIFLLREGTDILYEREVPETPGYKIDVPADLAGGAGGPVAPTGPPDWGTVLASADIAAGAAIVQSKCSSCHHVDPSSSNSTGPGLFGVVGRRPGSHAAFSYSSGMTAYGQANPTWDYDHLWTFIGAPARTVEGTRMTYVGLRSSDERVAVIAYLRSLGSTSVPIPAPDPTRAAPAAAGAPPAAGSAPATGTAPAAAGTAPAAPAATPAAAAPAT